MGLTMSGDLNAIGDGEPRVRVFGTVSVDGEYVTRSQGAILSALALRPGGTFSTGELIHALWPENVPTSARSSLQNQLARLRRTFGEDLIETARQGYRLGAVTDVQIFEENARIGSVQDLPPAEAVDVLEWILDLWTGEPFGSLMDHSEAQLEINRLDMLRLHVEECLATARLGAGQYEAAISELTVMVEAEPYREHRWELLMRALVENGRGGEALATYEQVSRRFREELGATPSQSLACFSEEIRRDLMPAHPAGARVTPNRAQPDPRMDCTGEIRMRTYGRCSSYYRNHRTRGGAE